MEGQRTCALYITSSSASPTHSCSWLNTTSSCCWGRMSGGPAGRKRHSSQCGFCLLISRPVEVVCLDVVDDRVLHEVLDTLSTPQCTPTTNSKKNLIYSLRLETQILEYIISVVKWAQQTISEKKKFCISHQDNHLSLWWGQWTFAPRQVAQNSNYNAYTCHHVNGSRSHIPDPRGTDVIMDPLRHQMNVILK